MKFWVWIIIFAVAIVALIFLYAVVFSRGLRKLYQTPKGQPNKKAKDGKPKQEKEKINYARMAKEQEAEREAKRREREEKKKAKEGG